ncbi:type II secretion system F family protein [Candidatus Woesearchaeota archaeon]|nr:type II secretion system F family protein [Candidatus Woesearchaeota archaeon]
MKFRNPLKKKKEKSLVEKAYELKEHGKNVEATELAMLDIPAPADEKHKSRPKEISTKKILELHRKIMSQKRPKFRWQHQKWLRSHLRRAGLEHIDEKKLTKRLFNFTIAICMIITIVVLGYAAVNKSGALKPGLMLVFIWTAAFVGVLLLSFGVIFLFLNLRMFNRTLALEAVLPDYLQLVSANISAGMSVDRALWYAVRPRFGILAKEIEEVAKATIAGEDLGRAMTNFANKYDSAILKRSVNLLLEGMRAGGEMAELISKIAVNIQENRIMKKEMAANVTTYVIFITFATVVAAPFLFALSTTLLDIITGIISKLDVSSGVGGMAIHFNADSIKKSDFLIFSMVTLAISSGMSAAIISVIRKGTVKQGVKMIPLFLVISIVIYLIAVKILALMMGGIAME